MLWDIIRDFFVMYIFGGNASNGNYYGGLVGCFCDNTNFNYQNVTADSLMFELPHDVVNQEYDLVLKYFNFADWLSTTFTIITLILICYMFLRLTIWLFKFGSGLFKW